MPDRTATLADIVKEWVSEHRWEVSCFGFSIVTPCECGSKTRYALINENCVTLTQAECSCVDCARVEVPACDPDFFNLLEKSLKSRLDHKSITMSNTVKSGGDIQHAIDHFHFTGNTVFLSGEHSNQTIDMKECKVVINGQVTGCVFDNIRVPIGVEATSFVTGCVFNASPDSQYSGLDYI